MSVKKVLFIDDGTIDNVVEKLTNKLRRKSISLSFDILKISDAKYKSEKEGDISLDFRKIQEELRKMHFNQKYDLVACDFNFANDPINGFKVLKWLKNTAKSERVQIRHAKYVFYSSEEDKTMETMLKNNDIPKLIRLKIEGFFGRPVLADEIATILIKESQGFDLSKYIQSELQNYSEHVFQNTYPALAGKKLGEIASLIENGDSRGIAFQKNIIDYAIAHLIEMNKLEK
ncbi:MAG: hypothetical protein COC22_01445 [Flavobacteriaceae bacterium]|nr:MAG: hypothetical protein COC22_01445 [Flavobacteriaceae bacterium]